MPVTNGVARDTDPCPFTEPHFGMLDSPGPQFPIFTIEIGFLSENRKRFTRNRHTVHAQYRGL